MKKGKTMAVAGTVIVCMLTACGNSAADNEGIAVEESEIGENTADAAGETATDGAAINEAEESAADGAASDAAEEPAADAADVVEEVYVKPKYSLDGKSASEIVALLNSYTNNIENGMTTEDIGSRFEYDFNHDEYSSPYCYSWFCEGGENGLNIIQYRFYSSGNNAISLDVKDYCNIKIYLNDFDIASAVYDTYVEDLRNFDNVMYIGADEKGTNVLGQADWTFEIDTENNVYTNFQAGLNIDQYNVHLSYLGDGNGYIVELKIPLNVEF